MVKPDLKTEIPVYHSGRWDTLFIEFPFCRKRKTSDGMIYELVLNQKEARQIKRTITEKGTSVVLKNVKPMWEGELDQLTGKGEHQCSMSQFMDSLHRELNSDNH